jgi:hypothetical protein
MKTKRVIQTLSKILQATKTIEGNTVFIIGQRRVVVIDQGGNAIALPMIGTQVVHNGNHTIKNLVSFLVQDLDADQVDYLKTLRSMYSTTPNERLVEMAKTYQPLTLS